MEDSQALKKIIDLGKTIVKELRLDPGVDTLARWMAHYVAERIKQAEKLEGEEQKKAEKECFDTILQLWKHRMSALRGNSFLYDYEELFQTLKRLAPNSQSPFYYAHQDLFENDELIDEKVGVSEEVNSHFDKAFRVDKVARSLIVDLLSKGVQNIDMDDEKKRAIENAINLIDYPDTRIIRFTTNYAKSLQAEEEEGEDEKERKIRELHRRIKDLEEFSDIKDSILERYKKELAEIEN